MEAILLAADQGRRFKGAPESACKVLIEVGGECLLDRHLDALLGHGVDHVTVVVGYERARIEARLADRPVSVLVNDRWTEGSLCSLYCARELLEKSRASIFMDADVLYDPAMIGMLRRDLHPAALLFDGDFIDKEMRAGVRGGKVVQLSKTLADAEYDRVGRGPGFYRVDRDTGAALAAVLAKMVADGQGGLAYEDALNALFVKHPFHPVPVAGLPWTKIDALEDLKRAESDIWPRLVARHRART